MIATFLSGERGLLVVSRRDITASFPELELLEKSMKAIGCRRASYGSITVIAWGPDAELLDNQSSTYLLNTGVRIHESDYGLGGVSELLGNRELLLDAMPPFAALTLDGDQLHGGVDFLGFRQVYACRTPTWSAVSTSARVLGRLNDSKIDLPAVAIQSLLGWQIGVRTMHEGVSKIPAGATFILNKGVLHVDAFSLPYDRFQSQSLDGAVTRAAGILRDYLSAYLDDHPDAFLQLTGGLDSRILLSAIPASRRSSVGVLTLRGSDADDVKISAELARMYGMRHVIGTLEGLGALTSTETYERCLLAARKIEGMADPLHFMAVTWAEAQFDQGHRLSGLGGEVARGFYYSGRPSHRVNVTRRRVEQLSAWRLFVNESVAKEALTPAFSSWSRNFAISEITDYLESTGLDWHSATDEFYLWHRMQRWSGVVNTAVCQERAVTNPMLDPRFIAIARGLPPQAKYDALFLGRLQMELDADLGRRALDGRPPPQVYAERGLLNEVRKRSVASSRLARKIRQRVNGSNRQPATSADLARGLADEFRSRPELLNPIVELGVFSPPWLAQVMDGSLQPSVSAISMMANILAVAN